MEGLPSTLLPRTPVLYLPAKQFVGYGTGFLLTFPVKKKNQLVRLPMKTMSGYGRTSF